MASANFGRKKRSKRNKRRGMARQGRLQVEGLEQKVLLAGDLSGALTNNSSFVGVAGSGDDHGDSANTSTRVSVPSTTQGNLGVSNDRDWFRFSAISGREYEFETVLGTHPDTKLRLIDRNGFTLIEENDDGGAGTASKIEWTATSTGDYFLEVIPFGSNTGTYSLITRGSDAPEALGIDIEANSVSENGGVTTAKVTRFGSTASPLTVTLSNNDPSELNIPSSLTIPAGSATATVNVVGVDDTIVDGNQTVTVTVSASGFINASDSVLVLDNDGNTDDHGNSSGSATKVAIPSTTDAQIETSGDRDFFAVDMIAGRQYEFETSLGTLTDTRLRLYATNGTTLLAEDGDSGQGLASKIVHTAQSNGRYYLEVIPFGNATTGSYSLITRGNNSVDTLSLSIAADSLSENGGTSSATVTRNGATQNAVLINLLSSDTTELTVPVQITIPSGSNSATFTVTGVDDNLVDGAQTVTVSASAAGFVADSDTISVTDNEGSGGGGGGGTGDDHGDNAASATSAVSPSTVQGNIQSGTDVDWFGFDASVGTDFEFETTLGTLADTKLRLIGTDGTTQLLLDDDGGVGTASKITWTAPSTGRYYLEVSAFAGTQLGTYSLALRGTGASQALTLNVVNASVLESNGVSQATIRRSGPTSSPLTVNLASSDTSELTVPAQVTIPAGSEATTFNVNGVDDSEVDGTQTVTVTGSAAGFQSGTDTVQVLDNDGGGGGGGDDHGNNAASATTVNSPTTVAGNIEEGTDTDWFAVNLVAGTAYEFETTLLGLPDGKLRLIDRDGTTQISENDDGGNGLASKISYTPSNSGTYYVVVVPFNANNTGAYSLQLTGQGATQDLTVNIGPTQVSEASAPLQATVTRTGSTQNALVVNLASSDTSEGTVPAQVTIPAGSNSATFTVTPVNDTIVDGTQSFTVTATAAGFTAGTDSLQVTDNDSGGGGVGDDHGDNAATATSVSSPSTVTGTIEEGTDTDWFAFSAISGNSYEFETTLNGLSDSVLKLYGTNGTQVLAEDDDSGTGRASKISWDAPASGTYYLEVKPFSNTITGAYSLQLTGQGAAETLTLDIASASIAENGSSQATVTRSGPTTAAVTVNLANSDTTEATAPSQVTIPAGQASATFTVTGVNDNTQDGNQTATFTASATGFTNGTDAITVTDINTGGGGGGNDDHGNNAATATSVSSPSVVNGNIEQGSDTDWFSFNAVGGTAYEFETTLNTLSDSKLRLIDTDGTTLIQENDDGGAGLASKIVWTAPNSGTYYVQVLPFNTTSHSGTYSLTFRGDGPQQTLSLDVTKASLQENGETSVATVTRSGSTSNLLVVNLSGSDATELSVPAQVVIPAGSNSATFNVVGVDDAVIDGTQTVTVTATANGFNNATDTVQVLDNETGGGGDDHGNNAATATAVASPSTQNGNIEVGTDTDWFSVNTVSGVAYTFETSLGTITDTKLRLIGPDGTTLIQENDDGGAGLASKISWTATSSATYYVQVIPFSNKNTGTYTVQFTGASSAQSLTLNLVKSSLAENGEVSQATVTRSGSTGNSLVVNLANNDTSELNVPATVTIPAGSSSVNFNVTGVDDALVDGTQTVTVTATASGYVASSDSIDVTDNDSVGGGDDHGNSAASATLVNVPRSVNGEIEQGSDTDWFKFSTVAGTQYEFEVTLGSLNDSKMRLIGTDGTTLIEEDDDDGVGLASKITWTAPTSDTYYLQVLPFDVSRTGTYSVDFRGRGTESLALNVVQASVSESGGASQATVTRSGSTAAALTVNLSSSDTSEATAPTQVTIPAGSASATFTVLAVDDAIIDGPQTVTITAQAAGLLSATDTLQVLDNDNGGSGDDHGDDASSATTVGIPSSVSGRIEEANDVDWFKFVATSGSQYSFETTLSTLSDSKLRLIGTDGTTQLLTDDDSGAGLASKITWTAPSSGTYYVEVAGFGSNTGNYSLTLSSVGTETLALNIAQDEVSENGGVAQATVSRTGATASALSVALSSNDTSELTVPATVTIPAGQTSVTFNLTAVDDVQIDGDQTVSVSASAAGFSAATDTIKVNDNDNGVDDHGNSAAASTVVSLPSLTFGTLERNNDSDWFRFNAQSGRDYQFRTVLHSLADSRLRLIGTDGVTQLALDEDSGSGQASLINWRAPATGTYYLIVDSAPSSSNALGTYQLDVKSISDDHGNTPAAATAINLPSFTEGAIELANDTDVFSFSVVAGRQYTFQTFAGRTLADTELAILSANGAKLAQDDDGGNGQLSRLVWTAPSSGTFYVAVTGGDGATGTYQLVSTFTT